MAVGAAVYLIWGLFPLYLTMLGAVPAPEVLSHRILWSVLLLAILLLAVGRIGSVRAIAPRTWAMLAGSALCIGINWLAYTWSVLHGHLLDASLGYFINPLISVLFGTLLLGERLTRPQWAAVALAGLGVAVVTIERGALPILSLTLAVSFALYGLLRKRAPVDPLSGLFVETSILGPVAAWWLWVHGSAFGTSTTTDLLLVGLSVITSLPLMMFGWAARRLRLTTIGLLQYIAPSIGFALAVFHFHEPLEMPLLIAFAFIWAGLALYVADGWRRARAVSEPAEAR